MVVYIMTEAEKLLADLIWMHEPVGSGELVKLAADSLEWKNLLLIPYFVKYVKMKFL